MIGIIAAMEKEGKMISVHMEDVEVEFFGGIRFTRGTLYGQDVVLAVCGVGKVFAAMCTEAMAIKYEPSVIINTGVAGTLTHSLTIGDLAIADRVCQYDMDTSAVGDEPGLISGINRIYFEADKTVADGIEKIARDMGANTFRGTVASGDRFIADKESKDKIVSMFGGCACEMEAGAVGHVCYVNKIPFVVIRAISDDADKGSCVDYPEFAIKAAKTSASILMEYIKNI